MKMWFCLFDGKQKHVLFSRLVQAKKTYSWMQPTRGHYARGPPNCPVEFADQTNLRASIHLVNQTVKLNLSTSNLICIISIKWKN